MKKLLLIGILGLLVLSGCDYLNISKPIGTEPRTDWDIQIERLENKGYIFDWVVWCSEPRPVGFSNEEVESGQVEIKEACYKKQIEFHKPQRDAAGYLKYTTSCERELKIDCEEEFSALGVYKYNPKKSNPITTDRNICCRTYPDEPNRECNYFGWCEGDVMYWDVWQKSVASDLIS